MRKYKFTKIGKYSLCALAFTILITSLVFVDISFNSEKDEYDIDYSYVSRIVIDKETAVMQSSSIIIKPFFDTNVKVLKNFYNYKATKEEQINSLLYYESTYMPSSSIAYGGVESFEVISILDGTVIDVKQDELLGNIVEIQHSNDVISIYQSVSDITVEKDQTVRQGDVIAKSGVSNINKDLNNHLLFEMIYKGQVVNPDDYYNKDLNEL